MVEMSSSIGPLLLGLGLAALLGVAAGAARLPPLVGYVLAGLLVGPHTPGPVLDAVLAAEAVMVGAALVLFWCGTGEAPVAVDRLRGLAFAGAIGQTIGLSTLGWSFGRSLGWGDAEGLALGLALAAPGVILAPRILASAGLSGLLTGGVLAGWLVASGLMVVVGMSGLWATAPETEGEMPGLGRAALSSALGGAVMAGAAVVLGRWVVPGLLAGTERLGAPDLTALLPPVIALGVMLAGALLVEIPLVLGAFLGGLAFAASAAGWGAIRWAATLRGVFAALLIVPVAAQFDPASLQGAGLAVVVVPLLVLVARPAIAWAAARFAGYAARPARLLAAGAGQAGEVSLVIAALAVTVGLLPAELRDVVLLSVVASAVLWGLLLGRMVAAEPAGIQRG